MNAPAPRTTKFPEGSRSPVSPGSRLPSTFTSPVPSVSLPRMRTLESQITSPSVGRVALQRELGGWLAIPRGTRRSVSIRDRWHSRTGHVRANDANFTVCPQRTRGTNYRRIRAWGWDFKAKILLRSCWTKVRPTGVTPLRD